MDEDDSDLQHAAMLATFQRIISLGYTPREQFILNTEVRKQLRQVARRRVWNRAVVWVTIWLFPHMWRIDRTTMER